MRKCAHRKGLSDHRWLATKCAEMSAIPETRTIDDYRRVTIPSNTVASFGDDPAFTADVRDGDIVLSPAPEDGGRTLTEKNRLRLPPNVAQQFDAGTEFAVIEHGDSIVLKPAHKIDIDL